MLVQLIFCVLLLYAAWSDVASFRIPNWVSIALVLLFFVNGLLHVQQFPWSTHLLAGSLTLIGGLCVYGFRVMGAGDVKLISATSLWLGLPLLPLFLVVMALAGAVTAIALVIVRKSNPERWLPGRNRLPAALAARGRVPYGVAIALASLLASTRLPAQLWQF